MKNELVPLANGTFREKKYLKVGDYLIDPYGKSTKVTSIVMGNKKQIYKVKFNDRRSCLLGEDEKLAVWNNKTKGLKTRDLNRAKCVSLSDMVDKYQLIYYADTPKEVISHRYNLPISEPVTTYSERQHIIAPYAMGVLLAEGSLHQIATKNVLVIASNELDIVHRFMTHAGLRKYTKGGQFSYYFRKKNNERVQTINDDIMRLDLAHTTIGKFIPDEYLKDSYENRLNLLKGLIDTDGSIHHSRRGEYYTVGFNTSSIKLKTGFEQLVRSLGIGCYWYEDKFTTNSSYRFVLYTPLQIWTSQKHTQVVMNNKLKYKSSKDRYVQVVGIEPYALDNYTQIGVDSPSGLFLGTNFIIQVGAE